MPSVRRQLLTAKVTPLALATALIGALIAGTAVLASAAESTAPLSNRVMTWNIHVGKDGGPAEKAKEIAKYRPQVLGIQEACREDVRKTVEILKSKYKLRYHIAYGTVMNDRANCGFWGGNAFGQAIISAAPITTKGNKLYARGGTEPRGYMWVETTVNGKKTRVFNTHLSEHGQNELRAEQVGTLVEVARQFARSIVLGDFNAQPHSSEMRSMWVYYRDADPNCGSKANAKCKATADAGPPRKKFDYVFLRKNMALPGVTVVNSKYSDHDIVYADLR
ncbi:endonuclease/exonuclease/phosphatase family protein [Micromonospora sp. NBC_01699]|uniref:endonuclease/exonuclease/phosphatase family protein n=1 Tax=Micromonospora sp. NBC_01699 TaxID=2975984 RepID=UPI002E2B48FA|nr:endonuclease/exonuclease/phosphatase family protein [Micromonospora sp. NBC_01699]